MELLSFLTLFGIFGLLAIVLRFISHKSHIPYPTLLVLGGYIAFQALNSLPIGSGLTAFNFHDTVYFFLLPILIYEIAFRLEADSLFGNLFAILLLSIPFMFASILISAAILYLGIADESNFPYIAALITAALLAANDPTAVVRIIEKLNVSPRLVSILKGESLFNSIIALVLVSLALNVEITGSNMERELHFLEGFTLFVQLFSGGILVGLMCGLLGWLLLHYSRFPLLRGIISIVIAYGTFFLAESILSVSGILAVLVAGLMLNAYSQRTEPSSQHWLDLQWRWSANIATSLLFLMLGMSIYLPVFQNQWYIIALGIFAVLFARAVIVFGGLWLHGRIAKKHKIPLQERIPLFWGGIKGTVTVVLFFALPGSLEYSYMIQAIVYGVVLFSLFIQAPMLWFFLPKRQ